MRYIIIAHLSEHYDRFPGTRLALGHVIGYKGNNNNGVNFELSIWYMYQIFALQLHHPKCTS